MRDRTRRLAGDLDFESSRTHELLVKSCACGPSPPLCSLFLVLLSVTNVNDVRVDAISAPLPHDTRGGQRVLVVGANFGLLPSYTTNAVRVTYGPSGTEYIATGCVREPFNNREVFCNTVAGSGVNLRWRVTVVDEGVPGDWGVSLRVCFCAYILQFCGGRCAPCAVRDV